MGDRDTAFPDFASGDEMKVSDYIAGVIGSYCPFVVQGGAAVHMIDSLPRYICCAHEQGAGFAADGYAKKKGLGVAVTTCGPGATNLLTAAASAYFESVPVLYLVGQQHGFQELDVVGMFKSVTHYAECVTSSEDLPAMLDEALNTAIKTLGPVLLNIFDEVYHGTTNEVPKPFRFDVDGVLRNHWSASDTKHIFSKARNEPGDSLPYRFMKQLNHHACTIVTDIGDHGVWVKQTSRTHVITDNRFGAMGYAIAASMGVAEATNSLIDGPVVCINGDGGIQMNIQELATIAKHNMDIKIFILNNGGYGMIRNTQDVWLKGRHKGCDLEDLPLVDFERVATAYGIPNRRWDFEEDFDFKEVLEWEGPILVNVRIDPSEKVL